MTAFKNILWGSAVVVWAPIVIALLLCLVVLIYVVWEIGYWLRIPYNKLLDLIEEIFSGGREESS